MRSVIDFHSHILPGVDDGSGSVEESLEMLRMAASQGIQTMVATPHFYARHDTPEKFLRRREEAEQKLRQAMAAHTGLPQIHLGAEVHFFPGMSHSDCLLQLTIGGKRCILIEMPMSPWTDSMYRELDNIQARLGLVPVIAHIDRYIAPLRTHRIPQRLREQNVLVQANASFFLNRTTTNMAHRMLRQDQIHLLGSDCHNLSHRPPNLGPALERIEERLGAGILERVCIYGQDVISGA